MSKIKTIYGEKILNSRGDWTIKVFVETDSGKRKCFAVPEGKSRGSYEAECISPTKALENIEKIEGFDNFTNQGFRAEKIRKAGFQHVVCKFFPL